MSLRRLGLETYDVHVTLFVEQSQLAEVSHSKQGAHTKPFVYTEYVCDYSCTYVCIHVQI